MLPIQKKVVLHQKQMNIASSHLIQFDMTESMD